MLGLALLTNSGTNFLLMPAPDVRASTLLGLGMLFIQFSIGAANDWFDVEADRLTKPRKPIPAGLVTRREAAVVAVASGGGGVVLALLVPRAPEPATALLLAAMLGCGLIYDAILKPTAFSWLPFAVAFPLLPVYAWMGTTGDLPPRPELLLPVAFLAGPMLQLANGLVDIEADARAGSRGLAETLGRQWAWRVMAGLQLFINTLAWLTLGPMSAASGAGTLGSLVAASSLSSLGVLLSAARADLREWGWRCQAVGLALLAITWLAASVRLG